MQNKGANLAIWNIGNYDLKIINSDIFVDGEKLIFYHFASLKQLSDNMFTSDLSRDANWDFIARYGFQSVRMIGLDNVWTAIRFKKPEEGMKIAKNFCSTNPAQGVDYKNRTVEVPRELQQLLNNNQSAANFFDSLAFTHRREYVEWIISAKREETKARRLETTMEKLIARKKNFNEK